MSEEVNPEVVVYARQPIPADVIEKINAPGLSEEKAETQHAFISYHENDKPLVDHLMEELAKHQFVSKTEADILSGNIIEATEKLMNKSRRIVVIVSPAYMEKAWNKFEHICAVTRNSIENRKLTITIFHDIDPREVPSYMKEIGYIQTTDELFWQRFINALQSVEIELSASIEVSGISEGLAWGYYINYLRLVAPGLKERLEKSKYPDDKTFTKFIILMPLSGDCSKINEAQDHISREDTPLKFTLTVSGCHDRDFSNSVRKITHPEKKVECYVVMEYATPLWTMYEMEMSCLARLSREGKQQEIKDFNTKLMEILATNPECKDLVVPLEYDDRQASRDKSYLSRKVFDRIYPELTQRAS